MCERELLGIQDLVFEQTVPIRIVLPSLEVPLCFNAKRILSLGYFAYSYLEVFLEKEKAQLKDLNFSVNGQVVKWHLPIGIIYDSFIKKGDEKSFKPLTIEAKFKDFPEGKVMRCDSKDIVKYNFKHAFKESCYITHENTLLVQRNLNIHENIINSIIQGDHAMYGELMNIVRNDFDQWKSYPFKFITKQLRVFCCFLSVESAHTFNDVLSSIKEKLTKSRIKAGEFDDAITSIENNKILFHGIHIPPETPLKEFAVSMIYPDGFLYGLIE